MYEQQERKSMNEETSIVCECPDGKSRKYRVNGQDYSQKCGGWKDPETGQIYAIANWGSARHWQTKTYRTFTPTEGRKGVETKTTDFTHGYEKQMAWWFAENDIDISSLHAITFTWVGRCGPSYNLAAGPMEGQHVSESLPAMIPREMMVSVIDEVDHGLIMSLRGGEPQVIETVEVPKATYEVTDLAQATPTNDGIGDLFI